MKSIFHIFLFFFNISTFRLQKSEHATIVSYNIHNMGRITTRTNEYHSIARLRYTDLNTIIIINELHK